MSPSMLNLKPEDIDNEEKRRNYAVAIIGCGLTGIIHAHLFAKAGFKVTCTDLNPIKVKTFAKGKEKFLKREITLEIKKYIKKGRLKITDNLEEAVSSSNILILTFQAKLDKNKKSDYSVLEKICKKVGLVLKRDSLVIVANVTGVGVTEGLVKQVLENSSGFKVGADFGLAYSPFQILKTLTISKRIVAAEDNKSLNAAAIVLEKITSDGLEQIENIKLAEAAVIFDAVQHDVNTALANEIALFCEKANVDYFAVQRIVNTLSKPTMSSAKTRIEPYLLLEEAENLNLKLQLPKLSRQINEKILKHTVDLAKQALKSCGKPLRRAKIALLGITQIPNTRSPPRKIITRLVKMLEAKGARITLYDPYLQGYQLSELHYSLSKTLTDAVEGTDCIIIGKGHDQIKRLNLKKLKITMKMPAAIVDLEGIYRPEKIEKAGFIYCGLGRGVWTK